MLWILNFRPTRASAAKAAEKIKSLIPILKRIETTLSTSTPTHAWSYNDVLDMILRDDEEFTVYHENENLNAQENDDIEDQDSEANEDRETSENTTETEEEPFLDSHENVSDSNRETSEENELLDPNLVHNMHSFLDNPSIAAYPQHHSQVNLGTVQNLGAVLDDVFNSNNGQTNRRSERPKARLDYRAMHHGK